MTISRDEALALAERLIMNHATATDSEFVILHEKTVEIERGWVFFYNSREFVETGNPISALAGNCPIFVNRLGNVRELPTAVPWEVGIKDI